MAISIKIPKKDQLEIEKIQSSYQKKVEELLKEAIFPESEYPEGFKEAVISLMKYQNKLHMRISDDIWNNLCTFEKPFTLHDISYSCINILKCSSPIELWDEEKYQENFGNLDYDILKFFNEIAYPKVCEIADKVQEVGKKIAEEICKPLRDSTNAKIKIMMKLSPSSTEKFV